MSRFLVLLVTMTAAFAAPVPAQQVTITPAPTWRECAKEGGICASRAGALVRYGAGAAYTHRVVNGAVDCGNHVFGDPAPNVAKTCAIASPAAVTVPKPTPTATPAPAPAPTPVDPRDRLGINVSSVNYWQNEPTFANQALGIGWLRSWQQIPAAQVGPDGMPLSVKGETLTGILIPPAPAYTGGDTTTVCKWQGTGEVYAGGDWSGPIARDAHSMTFRWSQGKPPRVWLELRASDAADPVRDLDCRLKTDKPDAVFAPQLLDYLKPFGVLRFLDWSTANSNVASRWISRGQPRGVSIAGTDGIALEYQVALANAVKASPWFTTSWNADDDYHRRMAQLVHDSIPSGRQVYVELSNEVWNYGFGQAHQVQAEGVAAKLSDNAFQAAQHRYAQRVIEVMAIWSKVYADRPRDLVRVVATQADNAWVGSVIMDWNGGAIRNSVDAIAIAPYFSVDLATGGAEPGPQVVRMAAAARVQIADKVSAYVALAKRTGKRLIAYEAGQHLVDPARVPLVTAIQRDPGMEAVYREYIAGWQAATGDLLTLYAATGPISQYGAWGLREYAGQPLSETPKLRGVLH